jgi:membrane associated rhomboid family serine protease
MSGFFGPRDNHSEPWFRIGRLEVTTVVLVLLVAVGFGLAWVARPSLPATLLYTPEAVASGEVWRLITWPFANVLDLWTVITLALFWYFGTELERLIGHVRMVWLLLGMWASLTAAYTVVALLVGGGGGLAGLGTIEFLLLLLWIAEYPRRPFFFGLLSRGFFTRFVE